MCVQDRLHNGLQSNSLPHDLHPSCDLAAHCLGMGIRHPASGKKPLAWSRARTVASITSVSMRASAISRTWRGLAMITCPTCGANAAAAAAALPVASALF
jgi:hypothetical protein